MITIKIFQEYSDDLQSRAISGIGERARPAQGCGVYGIEALLICCTHTLAAYDRYAGD